MIRLDRIIVTQNSLRDIEQAKRIAGDLAAGIWFDDSIQIIRTEDEILYLHNGHHRAFAMFLAGINELPLDKYVIRHMKRKQLESINFDVGYVTPFDPRYYCRKADFSQYKAYVLALYDSLGYRAALKYIIRHELDYLEQRQVSLVEDMYYD